MFNNMSGKQLAGWGYGIFWSALLVEFINVVIGALNPHTSPVYWFGLALSLSMAGIGIRMLTLIRHRPW